jgi:hypothetical protein
VQLSLGQTTTAYALEVSAWSQAFNVTGSVDSNYAIRLLVQYNDGTRWCMCVCVCVCRGGLTGTWNIGTQDNSWYATFSVGTHYFEYVMAYFYPAKPISWVTIQLVFGTTHNGTVLFDDPYLGVAPLARASLRSVLSGVSVC